MGAIRRSLQAQPKILKKLSEHQIYESERNFFQKKYAEYLKNEKEPKICIGATRRNLQAHYRNTKSTNQKENFPKKKVCLVP
jgi:hypothetical protein